MKIKNQQEWDSWNAKNTDPYGHACFVYAKRWADLMEKEMDQGKNLVDIAKDASHVADEEGITGFMYGCAVSILSTCWEHGEELRKWNNLDLQIGNEGEKAKTKTERY